MNRAQREATEAAERIFGAAGWPFRRDVGGKHHVLSVTAPDGSEHRLPVAGTPAKGPTGAVNLAMWTARKLLRKFGVEPA